MFNVFFFFITLPFILFLLVSPNPVAFLLNVTSTVMFWMSACQSILCTVHLTWSLCRPPPFIWVPWSCCWPVDSIVPRPIMTYCARPFLRICSCLTGMHGFKEDNLFKPNSSEMFKKEKSCTQIRQCTVALLGLICNVLVISGCACCYDIISLCFIELEQCDFYQQWRWCLCNRIYCV